MWWWQPNEHERRKKAKNGRTDASSRVYGRLIRLDVTRGARKKSRHAIVVIALIACPLPHLSIVVVAIHNRSKRGEEREKKGERGEKRVKLQKFLALTHHAGSLDRSVACRGGSCPQAQHPQLRSSGYATVFTTLVPTMKSLLLLLAMMFWCKSSRHAANAFSSSAITFDSFQFAPNGVCISPRYFCDSQTCFTMKNVPGKGDCMFLAVALASLCSVGLGANDCLLNSISTETRHVVADVLEHASGTLVIQGKRLVSTSSLLTSAAKDEGVSPVEYIEMLRNGSLYGGGPELTVLANLLRRPISIYELSSNDNDSIDDTTTLAIQCMGTFGESIFADPLANVPDSAILNNNKRKPGAYSWHLHILVVDTSLPDEKHACVLLPQSC